MPAHTKFLAFPNFELIIDTDDLEAYGISEINTITGNLKIKTSMFGDIISETPVDLTKNEYLMHIIENMGNKVTSNDIYIYIGNLLTYNLITEKEAKLLKVATSDNVLNIVQNIKDELRASIFKNMLLNLIDE